MGDMPRYGKHLQIAGAFYKEKEMIQCYELPNEPVAEEIYRLLPRNADPEYYRERTDRNIGWITRAEQEMLRGSAVGIAGCGGMGGELAEKLLRLGIGEIRIADTEVFDISNINRQFAAARATVGRSKAFLTARKLRDITDDTTIALYPRGIREDSAFDFVRGCSAICDEIEFWCLGSRILLHRAARECGVPVFVCNSQGFGTQLFLFTPASMTMEECLGMEYAEAKELEEKIQKRSASRAERTRVISLSARTLCSEWHEYCAHDSPVKNRAFTEQRLLEEGCGAVVATNLALAVGFIANRVLLHLLQESAVQRRLADIPEMPGYGYLDAAAMEAKIVKGMWW